jgi:signal transduction histidine kinase
MLLVKSRSIQVRCHRAAAVGSEGVSAREVAAAAASPRRSQGGRGVAFRWRIRHKLMLGLGLVVGIIALLLAGTVYGLESFRTILKSIDSKQAELSKANAFKEALGNNLGSLSAADLERGNGRKGLLDVVREAREKLKDYRVQLQDTLDRGRDPDKGFQEQALVDHLEKSLNELAGLGSAGKPFALAPGANSSQQDAEKFTDARNGLNRDCNDLIDAITHDLTRRSQEAKSNFRRSLWILFLIGIGAIILLCSFIRFFYRWVFYPIRDLEEGAGRVAQGDFEHRIDVHSGDEMEDLAAAFNDMTSRLREMYRDLARQVNERSRQLVRSERLAGVGFLAAGVAHEINNPLASIAFCSEALEGRLSGVLAQYPGDGEVVTKYLKMIQQEAFRCKAITQRLLEFSRGGERRREPTDLAELIQGVLEVVQHLQNCKGKTIHFAPAGRLVAWVNAQEIKSVVLNLVVNALDSMDDGGTLTITLRQRDFMAEMVFADTGCGMSAEILENIFEPFFTRSRTGKGTGLGLSISHRVINQHGGEIEAASPGLNQGSTFTVRLPLQPAEPSKEEALGHAAA